MLLLIEARVDGVTDAEFIDVHDFDSDEDDDSDIADNGDDDEVSVCCC